MLLTKHAKCQSCYAPLDIKCLLQTLSSSITRIKKIFCFVNRSMLLLPEVSAHFAHIDSISFIVSTWYSEGMIVRENRLQLQLGSVLLFFGLPGLWPNQQSALHSAFSSWSFIWDWKVQLNFLWHIYALLNTSPFNVNFQETISMLYTSFSNLTNSCSTSIELINCRVHLLWVSFQMTKLLHYLSYSSV